MPNRASRGKIGNNVKLQLCNTISATCCFYLYGCQKTETSQRVEWLQTKDMERDLSHPLLPFSRIAPSWEDLGFISKPFAIFQSAISHVLQHSEWKQKIGTWSEETDKESWKKPAGPRNSYCQAGISRQPSAAPVYQECNKHSLRSFKGQGQTNFLWRVFLFIGIWMQMLLGLSVSLFLDWGHFNFHKRIQMIRSNLSHT